MPARVWLAIGPKDRKPTFTHPALQIVRFQPTRERAGIKQHDIEGVSVAITNPARTVVDLFRYRSPAGTRYRKSPGLNLAMEGLREALRQRKASPAEIARFAEQAGIWRIVQLYLEAMTSHA